MLSPFLVVGVGGSGGKTLRALRQALRKKLENVEGWDGTWPVVWQLLHIDTPSDQDGEEFSAPLLAANEYAGLVASAVSYDHIITGLEGNPAIRQAFKDEILLSLPGAGEVAMPVHKGAGQFRAVGRAIVVSKLRSLKEDIQKAVDRMNGPKSRADLEFLSNAFGAKDASRDPSPMVFLVSSVAGGSGAGQFMDVAEVIKSIDHSKPWVNQIFSLLFAPDVFDGVPGRAGIAPNSIAAVAELTAGKWRKDLSEPTQELYSSMGMPTPNAANYNLGPKANLIIGRQNGKVTFDSQGDVYNAVALSLSAWMTDPKVADDIMAYAVTNESAQILEDNLPDYSRLKVANSDAPPIRSIGFSRVSLGGSRFADYASERLARAAIERMLYQHLSQNIAPNIHPDEYWVEKLSKDAWPTFHDKSGLNDLKPNDQILDAIRPIQARKQLRQQLMTQLTAKASEGIDPKKNSRPAQEWIDLILQTQAGLTQRFLRDDEDARTTSKFVNEIQVHLQTLVAKTIAREGLAVTIRLLEMLQDALENATVQELEAEAGLHDASVMRAQGTITNLIQEVKVTNAVPAGNEKVIEAIKVASQAIEFKAEADLKRFVVELIKDMVANFIKPLVTELGSKYSGLKSHVDAPKSEDGRGDNPFADWPLASGVPKRFSPAPNEKLLISESTYVGEFDRLLMLSVQQQQMGSAMTKAIEELISGGLAISNWDGVAVSEQWSAFKVTQNWSPRILRDAEFGLFAPIFESSLNSWQERARNYLLLGGRPFGTHIRQTLAGWLDAAGMPQAEQNARRQLFASEIVSAIALSAPLVELNAGLLKAVHVKDVDENNTMVSDIPVDLESPLGQQIASSLQNAKIWNDNSSPKKFVGNTGTQREVEFFSMPNLPYQPLVYNSLLSPVAQAWMTARANPMSRAAFLTKRRARPLAEAIPLSPRILDQVLRGWFVAKALSRLEADNALPTRDANLGPKIEIWGGRAGERAAKTAFPYPLFYPGDAPATDYPGIVAGSIVAAMVECNSVSNISPLYPYHSLMDLGGQDPHGVPFDLKQWIDSGLTPQGMPTPVADRAGTSTGTVDQRKAALLKFFTAELENFELENIGPAENFRRYSQSWELRREITRALKDLTSAVAGHTASHGGV